MQIAFEIGCVIILAVLSAGSLLNLSHSPHWFVRGWDFPRIQILAIAIIVAAFYFLVTQFSPRVHPSGPVVVSGLLIFLLVWHTIRIAPYTVLAPLQTKPCLLVDLDRGVRVVVSNVERENQQYERWMQVIQEANPDLLIVLEVDQVWMEAIEKLRRQFRHEIAYPQDNWYGMLLLSNLTVKDSEIRFLVESDVPSIDTSILLRSGDEIRVVAIHPRPPEPIRDNDSEARDAELIAWARTLREEKRGVIVGGDLNDVAWSPTTRLSLTISGLLDPRRGRGFYNSFHADHWWMRFPLDQLFHSKHFTLKEIERLPKVGSDHFPILLDLQYQPDRQDEQESLQASAEDYEHAEELSSRENTTDAAADDPPGNHG